MPDIYPIIHEGIRNGSTFFLDETTKSAIENDPNSICGQVVTIVGNNEVGYGSSGDAPLGFVEMVENEKSNSERFMVSVVFNQAREDIACSGVTAGDYLACDGNGGFAKASGVTNARTYTVSEDGSTCAAYISG